MKKAIIFIVLLFFINQGYTLDKALLNKSLTNITTQTTQIISLYNNLTIKNYNDEFSQLIESLKVEISNFKDLAKKGPFDENEQDLEKIIKSNYILKLDLLTKTLDEIIFLYKEPIDSYNREKRLQWNKRIQQNNQKINDFVDSHNQLISIMKKTYQTE